MAKKQQPIPAPDRTIKLDELHGFVHRIAAAMIERHGFYTFTDFEGRKTLVVR